MARYEETRRADGGMGGGHMERRIVEVDEKKDKPTEGAVKVADDAPLCDWTDVAR